MGQALTACACAVWWRLMGPPQSSGVTIALFGVCLGRVSEAELNKQMGTLCTPGYAFCLLVPARPGTARYWNLTGRCFGCFFRRCSWIYDEQETTASKVLKGIGYGWVAFMVYAILRHKWTGEPVRHCSVLLFVPDATV